MFHFFFLRKLFWISMFPFLFLFLFFIRLFCLPSIFNFDLFHNQTRLKLEQVLVPLLQSPNLLPPPNLPVWDWKQWMNWLIKRYSFTMLRMGHHLLTIRKNLEKFQLQGQLHKKGRMCNVLSVLILWRWYTCTI